jgi:hypothetical protein
MKILRLLPLILFVGSLLYFLMAGPPACLTGNSGRAVGNEGKATDRVTQTDEAWRRLLTPEQYRVTRQQRAISR